ncbi:MAG: hypothetical protein ACOCXA_09355 [Planctomycetota bacterium]
MPQTHQRPLFDRRARPHRAMRLWTRCLALLTTAACFGLLPLLIPAPHLGWYGVGGMVLGLVLGGVIVVSVERGTRLTVDADGILTYHLGSRPNLQVPLSAIRHWAPVRAGFLRGIGADCPLEAVRILHRKGVRYAQLHEQQQELGTALVFEFQDPGDIPRLRELHETWAGQQASDDPTGSVET